MANNTPVILLYPRRVAPRMAMLAWIFLLHACSDTFVPGGPLPLVTDGKTGPKDRGPKHDAKVLSDLHTPADMAVDAAVADQKGLKTPDAAGKDKFVWPDVLPWPDKAAPSPDLPLTKPDTGSGGPVARGFYSYTAVPVYGMVNPVAAAYHPSGAYALVLEYTDKVHKFIASTKAVTQATTVGASLYWREVVFTKAGDKAALLANNLGTNEGRIYIWDHATSALSELSSFRFSGGTYEALVLAPGGTKFKLLGSKKGSGSGYLAHLWDLDPSMGTSNVKANFSSAGCQDLALATDSYGNPAVAVACGVNGATLMHLDGGGNWNTHTQNAGNTSRVEGRPQMDYALAICWSCSGKVYRFEKGAWDSSYSSPQLPGSYQVRFSSDGMRALLLGGYGGSPVVGQAYEYRHNLMGVTDFTDVGIPNFDKAPYNATSGVQLNDAAWQPGCDGGIIVGGASTLTAKKGYVIQFQVTNGKACP